MFQLHMKYALVCVAGVTADMFFSLTVVNMGLLIIGFFYMIRI